MYFSHQFQFGSYFFRFALLLRFKILPSNFEDTIAPGFIIIVLGTFTHLYLFKSGINQSMIFYEFEEKKTDNREWNIIYLLAHHRHLAFSQ